LPLARTKDVSLLDDELSEKASVRAGIPRGLVKDVAHETVRSFVQRGRLTIFAGERSTNSSSLRRFSGVHRLGTSGALLVHFSMQMRQFGANESAVTDLKINEGV
jgi:hypothetical protein